MLMKRETRIKIGKIILKNLAAAGFLSMAILTPNTLRSLEMFYGNKKRKYEPKYQIKRAITRLREEGLIEFQNREGEIFVHLTDKGKRKILKYQLQEIIIKKPKKWDRKWRVIIFDIKEYKRKTRDALRKELINLGFLKLQNSVWTYPYDCEEVAILFKAYFHLGGEVLYLLVDKIENDEWLKREFNLNKLSNFTRS